MGTAPEDYTKKMRETTLFILYYDFFLIKLTAKLFEPCNKIRVNPVCLQSFYTRIPFFHS